MSVNVRVIVNRVMVKVAVNRVRVKVSRLRAPGCETRLGGSLVRRSAVVRRSIFCSIWSRRF